MSVATFADVITARIFGTFPASAPAGTRVLASFVLKEGGTTYTAYTVPQSEVWHIARIYVPGSTPSVVNAALVLVIGEVESPTTFREQDVLQNVFGYVALPKTIPIPGGSTFAFILVSTAANGSSALTVTFYVHMLRMK
jgi:hypothetical protein